MFKKVTKSIANQMDPSGDLVPVSSILDHEHFRPLCLVTRKRKTLFRPFPCYKRTWYRLDDMLLPGKDNKSTEPLFPNGGDQESRQFTVKENTSDSVDGNLSLCVAITSIEVKGALSLSKGWSIKLEKNHISLPKLEALKSERKINANHAFIQQLKKARHNLYVVHEIVETSEEARYEESTTTGFMAQLHAKLGAKGARENTQSITIPKGCTLAFRAIKLLIEDGSWDLEYFPEERSVVLSDGVLQGKLGELEKEVKKNSEILSKLSSDLFIITLRAKKLVMKDRNLFQELTEKERAVPDYVSTWKPPLRWRGSNGDSSGSPGKSSEEF
ncbi:gasdermin-A-like [Theristicus caerulescens]